MGMERETRSARMYVLSICAPWFAVGGSPSASPSRRLPGVARTAVSITVCALAHAKHDLGVKVRARRPTERVYGMPAFRYGSSLMAYSSATTVKSAGLAMGTREVGPPRFVDPPTMCRPL